MIAHRLATIQNTHRIVVLTDEGIQEQGTTAGSLKKMASIKTFTRLKSSLTFKPYGMVRNPLN